jgi:SAM-dependent methyltransferase
MDYYAMKNGKEFFDCYSRFYQTEAKTLVVDIGSQDVNGSLKEVCPKNFQYLGLDFIEAKNVDIVLTDPYKFPLENDSVDIVVTSSCFEHSEFFWLVYLEAMRILKPKGIMYINSPSRGIYHRYPVDCWRFYPDSGLALSNWGKVNGYNNVLLESYVQKTGDFGDYVGVFLKDSKFSNLFTRKIIDDKKDFINGRSEKDLNLIVNPLKSNNGEIRSPKRFIPKFLRPLFGYHRKDSMLEALRKRL